MTSFTEIPNGDLPFSETNQEHAPNNDVLLAALVQTIESLAHRINLIPKQPQTPPRFVVSPSREDTTDNHSARWSAKPPEADDWQTILHKQMAGQAKQIWLLQ
ncbi:hypothetical protein CJ030_MR0G004588 [Morella rubra]|uniref:Uncharacterized protein n=1 Tax=Morella rubra TaxID=262757 RepID=A0A6A1UQ65_9ROSI|nr:hypothetical protein CJ030_MR0G004588 [Morella rubra]